MESIRGFLLYATSTYRYMTPYLKGLSLTLYIWRPYIDEEGWGLRGGSFKLSELDIKWEGTEELNKPELVIGVTR